MQLILAVTSVEPTNDNTIIDKSVIRQTLSAYKQGRDLNDEVRARQKLISEIINSGDGSDGLSLSSLCIATVSGCTCTDGCEKHEAQLCVTASGPGKNILEILVQKFQEKVKISLYLKWYIPESGFIISYGSVSGMKIDPEAFFCVGCYSEVFLADSMSLPQPTQDINFLIQVEIVADIDLASPNGISPAQKILEKGEYSDVIIAAGNGAHIKAHKLFLCVSSPVLEAMLKSGMEEAQTGRVDMSDLSQDGVMAFLRYIYFEDLKEPRENIQIAYELFYASHKYDVPRLETQMKTLFLERKIEDIDAECAFKLYMFTRNIESAVELNTKTIQILKSKQLDQLYADRDSDESTLGSEIEAFLAAADDEDFNVALAFKMYMLTRDIESAVDLKNKAFKVVKAKWRELESLQEYNDLFEKPSNAKAAKELCRDIWLANTN